MRHPSTKTWTVPPERQPRPDRLNLRELAARPDRFEHHLIVVARIGSVQLEVATASEPLYFAHVNISDEYAVALPTGDPLLDAFPLRTFVSDRDGVDVGRYNHKSGDLVLHPVGYAHWPGKLRPPYAGLDIPPGMRRCGVSLVYCASVPTPSTAEVVLLPAARAGDVKSYASPAPMAAPALSRPMSSPSTVEGTPPSPTLSLAALSGPPGVIARVGNTSLVIVDSPTTIGSHGGWVVVISGDAPHAPFDLLRIAPGAPVPTGIARALVFSGDREPDPVPPSWTALPAAPFPVFEDAPRGALPFVHDGLRIEERSPSTVAVLLEGAVAEVPRYWLARMLFRLALHDLRLNYVETYGGFFVDDSQSDVRLGLRIESRKVSIAISRADAALTIERLYRAVAPPDYRERLE